MLSFAACGRTNHHDPRSGCADRDRPDCSNCPCHVKGLLLCTPETLGLWALLQMEKNCPSLPGIHGQNGILPPKVLDPKIAPTPKLPLQTRLADLALLRASSHLPSKHWGCMLFFLWKRTGLFCQAKRAEIGIPHSRFQISKSCPKTNLPGQTGLSGLGLWWRPLTAPETLGLCGFLPVETMVTLWGPRGTKDITVALLGPMVPRAQCEAAGLCGTKRPLLHYRASCSHRAMVILQGTVDPWRLL